MSLHTKTECLSDMRAIITILQKHFEVLHAVHCAKSFIKFVKYILQPSRAPILSVLEMGRFENLMEAVDLLHHLCS